jgi:hypothetical protein
VGRQVTMWVSRFSCLMLFGLIGLGLLSSSAVATGKGVGAGGPESRPATPVAVPQLARFFLRGNSAISRFASTPRARFFITTSTGMKNAPTEQPASEDSPASSASVARQLHDGFHASHTGWRRCSDRPIDHHKELSLGCPDPNRNSYIVPPGQVPRSVHDPAGSEELTAIAATPDESIASGAVSFSLRDPESPGARPDSCLFVALAEEVREPVQIARVVFGGGPASECPLTEPSGLVTATPPSPFSGTATLQRNRDGLASWAGSLSVPMLGLGAVTLAGPAFRVELSQ